MYIGFLLQYSKPGKIGKWMWCGRDKSICLRDMIFIAIRGKRKRKSEWIGKNEQREWFDKSFSFGLVLQLMIKHFDKKRTTIPLLLENIFFFFWDFQLHVQSLRLPPAIERNSQRENSFCSESMALLILGEWKCLTIQMHVRRS